MHDASLLRVVAVALVLAESPAAAQPTACDVCVRGDAIIERFSLQAVRPLAAELARLPLADPLTPLQYTRIIELRQRAPALVRLGAVDDADLALVAAALCQTSSDACTAATTRALRCLAERCDVALPEPDPRRVDVAVPVTRCDSRLGRKRSPRLGLGFDWGTGAQRSRYPNDGGAWSFGIESRMRVTGRIGAIARVDRSAGRDEALDNDGDGIDDASTGSITRITALAGPSFVLDHARFTDTSRFVRLDVLGGYLATRSQRDESGPAAGLDLAYQLSVVRAGIRFVQGFGGARDASMLLAHLGFVVGSAPKLGIGADCDAVAVSHSSRLALGFSFPLGGYGVSSQLGYLGTGLGLEALWYLTRAVDAVTHADLLLYPGGDRDRVLHQAVLAGVRVDHGARTSRSSRTGVFTTVMAGYSHAAGLTPTSVGSGPVVDLSLAWGPQSGNGAGYLRLHGRFGVSPDNFDYIAVFLSAGFELRFDRRRWRDRI